ncbi:MAG: FGGY-family carbohydrate kinase [Promethearchaeota archaeon]|jgi:xylulokinase
MSELLCVFDVGTTGSRTIIFDINGREIAKAYEEYPLVEQPVGVSEQDPIIWWNATKNTCKQVLKQVNVDDIIGISASILRTNTTIINKFGEPLHAAITAMDERGLALREEEGLRLAIPKLLWLKKERSNLYSKIYKIMFPDTYIYMKLCGNNTCITEPTNGIYGIMDVNTLDWDKDLADIYDLPVELWPKIHTPGEYIGELTNDAAKELGLKSKLPVILGGGDQQCSALGMGVINQGQAKVTIGTYTFAHYVTGNKAINTASKDIPVFSIPHVIKGKWILEGGMPGTGIAMKWFKDNFSQLQTIECLKNNLDVYDIIIKEAEEIPPGSEGLLFIPLQIFRKGTIHGLGWNHTRAHMIRSIMESAALSAQLFLNLLEGMGGGKVDEIKADGGAMNSDLWAQILADVTDKKVFIPIVRDSATLGAAILGFYGCKKYNSIDEAIKKMVKFEKEFNPIKANTKVYKKLNRLFLPLTFNIYENKRVTKDL